MKIHIHLTIGKRLEDIILFIALSISIFAITQYLDAKPFKIEQIEKEVQESKQKTTKSQIYEAK